MPSKKTSHKDNQDLKFSDIGPLFKSTFIAWNEKDPFRQSAVIAYYSIFAIPGLLVLIITMTGYFFDKESIDDKLIAQITHTLGKETALQIKDILTKATASKSTLLGSIVGIFILLLGATGVFVELQKTLNTIWQVKVIHHNGIIPYFKSRLFSFGLIISIAFLLLISLVASTAIAALGDWISVDTSVSLVVFFNVLNFLFSLVLISVLFALMFKILPDAKIKWKHVWLGSLVTGILFTIGKTALAFYFGRAHPGSLYGAAASIILILLWVSYSSMIMFFGAEFTATYARMFSEKVGPKANAKAVTSTEKNNHSQ